MPPILRQSSMEGLLELVFENDAIRMSILPELGGKVISLLWKPSGREFLWRHPGRPFRRPDYGAAFDAYDISGWDECFPTIAEVVYPEPPWQGVVAPDHGELWTLAWEWELAGNTLRMWVDGVRFPYRFERSFTLGAAGEIDIAYRVTNRAPFPLKTLWSMHPFFTVSPGSRVLLPPDVSVRVDYSMGWRLDSYLARHPWPLTTDSEGVEVDLGLMGAPDQGFMEKLFTTRLPAGWAALHDEEDGHFLAFTFDPEETPFVGICQMRGGWPESDPRSYSTILEPCSGWPDHLDIAISRGECVEIPAGSQRDWHITMHLGQGWPALARILDVPADSTT